MYCIISATTDLTIDWSPISHHTATSNTGTLALSQTCKRIRKEYLSLWMSTVTIRLNLSRLGHYMQKLHSLSITTNPHAKLHLLLPNNNDRRHRSPSYTDITALFKLMIQREYFTLTIGQTSQDHEYATAEARELQELLRTVSQKLRPSLDRIISVQLLMRKAGWDNRTPPSLYDEHQRPSVHFTFAEHTTLPGEWPWWGAHDLNHESLELWTEWMEDCGACERWHVHVTAQRVVDGGEQALSVWRNDLANIGVSPSSGYLVRRPWESMMIRFGGLELS